MMKLDERSEKSQIKHFDFFFHFIFFFIGKSMIMKREEKVNQRPEIRKQVVTFSCLNNPRQKVVKMQGPNLVYY